MCPRRRRQLSGFPSRRILPTGLTAGNCPPNPAPRVCGNRAETQVFAVTGIPEEKKGERLAVLHTLDEARIPEILSQLAANGLPNLFIPSRANFVRGETLPVLGTGKMDLRSLKRIAMERLAK